MKPLLIVLGILCLLFGAWILFGWLSVRNVEQPKYKVVSQNDVYEIREYEPHLIAKVTVEGTMDEALNEGFRQIAAFIFGENKNQEPVAMTTPVTSQESDSTNIAMTTPVTTQEENGVYTIAFIMPSEYTLETLPKPLNEKIIIEEIPSTSYAVLTFSGYATEKRTAEKMEILQKAIQEAELTPLKAPILSQYNPPWTPWFMRRNEIWIEIETDL